MIDTLWYPGVFALIVLVTSYCYSRRILQGIAAVRDEQHRLTLLSPWYFFMRELKSRSGRLIIGLLLWQICGVLVRQYEFIYGYWLGVSSIGEILNSLISTTLLLVGVSLFSFGIITLSAPRFEHPLALAFIGTFVGMLCLILMSPLVQWIGVPAENELLLNAVLIAISLVGFCLVWLFVRYKCNRAWFHFDA